MTGNERPPATGSPGKVKQLLQQHGFSFRKSLGQNFLVDGNIARNIVAAAALGPDKGALEIGPGVGALTERLAAVCGKVVAIEIDGRLLPILRQTVGHCPNVAVIHGDVLKADLPAVFREHFAGLTAVSVVANLPYYITTPIVMKLLEERLPVESIVVMVQKEVADRFAAQPGTKSYGSLSVAVQYRASVETVARVPRTVFIPQPNVDSAVVKLTMRPAPAIRAADETMLFDVVEASFAQRRKTLLNNLEQRFFREYGAESKERCRALLAQCGIVPERRGETLTLAEFGAVADALSALRSRS